MVNYCNDCKDDYECHVDLQALRQDAFLRDGFKCRGCGHEVARHKLARDPASSSTMTTTSVQPFIFSDGVARFEEHCANRNATELNKLCDALKRIEQSYQESFSNNEHQLASSRIQSDAISTGDSEEGEEGGSNLTGSIGSTNFPEKPPWGQGQGMSDLSSSYKNDWINKVESTEFQELTAHEIPEDVLVAFECLRILILWMHAIGLPKESMLQKLILVALSYMAGHDSLLNSKYDFVDARQGDDRMLYLDSTVFGKRRGYTDIFLTKDGYFVALFELKLFLTRPSSLGQCVAGLQALTKAVNGSWDCKLSQPDLCRPVGVLYNGLGALRVQTAEGGENHFRMDAESVKGFTASTQLIWSLLMELAKTDDESMVFSPMKTRLQRKQEGRISRFMWSSGSCRPSETKSEGNKDDHDGNDSKQYRKGKSLYFAFQESTSNQRNTPCSDRASTSTEKNSKQHTWRAPQPHELLILDIENMARRHRGEENWVW